VRTPLRSANLRVNNASFKARENGARIALCDVRRAGDWAVVGILDVDYPLMVRVAERMCELTSALRRGWWVSVNSSSDHRKGRRCAR